MAVHRVTLPSGRVVTLDYQNVDGGLTYPDLDLNSAEHLPLRRALASMGNASRQERLEAVMEHVRETSETPVDNTELIETHGDAINEITGTTGAETRLAEGYGTITTLQSQASVVDGNIAGVSIDDVLYGIPASSIEVEESFVNNLENIAGTLTSYVSAVRDIPILYPKAEVTAKLIVMPEWDNPARGSVELDRHNNKSWSTTDFILQNVSEQESDKHQIIETLGESYVYFYGERPRIYSFSGSLLNAKNKQWKNDFMKQYRDLFRGTKCAENKTRTYIMYDDMIIEGYILNMNISTSSQETKICPFSFNMYVTNTLQMNSDDLINAAKQKKTIKNMLDYYKQREHVSQHEVNGFINDLNAQAQQT